MSDEKPGCLRFSLRTLFLLILVCVIPLSVLTRKLLYVASQKQAAAEIRESGGSVVFSYDAPPRAGGYPFVRSIRPPPPSPEAIKEWFRENVLQEAIAATGRQRGTRYQAIPLARPPRASVNIHGRWSNKRQLNGRALARLQSLRWLSIGTDALDDELMEAVGSIRTLEYLDANHCSGLTDRGMQHLRRLSKLKYLRLRYGDFSDEGLACLADLTSLESLTLSDNPIGDLGVAHLANLRQLRSLELANTQVSDGSLKTLARLEQLERLSLRGTQITEAGLPSLLPLGNLTWLNLSDTSVGFRAASQLEDHYRRSIVVR